MKKISLKQTFAEQVKKGYPLISKDAVSRVNGVQEGELIEWVDERGSFLGKGYYGVQNKGIGWVLSFDANEKIDHTFLFLNLNRHPKAERIYFVMHRRRLSVCSMGKGMELVESRLIIMMDSISSNGIAKVFIH